MLVSSLADLECPALCSLQTKNPELKMRVTRAVLTSHFLTAKAGLLEPSDALVALETVTLSYLVSRMREEKRGCALLTNDQQELVGIFSERDLLRSVLTAKAPLWNEPMSKLMTEKPETVDRSTSVARALHLFAVKGFRNIPLLAGEGVIKLISINDVVNYIYGKLTKKLALSPEWELTDESALESFFGSTVAELSPNTPETVSPGDSVRSAALRMAERNIGSVIVTSNGKRPEGILTERDLLFKATDPKQDLSSLAVSSIMTPKPVTLQKTATVTLAFNTMSEGGFRHLPIVDHNEELCGVLSAKNFINRLTDNMLKELEKVKE